MGTGKPQVDSTIVRRDNTTGPENNIIDSRYNIAHPASNRHFLHNKSLPQYNCESLRNRTYPPLHIHSGSKLHRFRNRRVGLKTLNNQKIPGKSSNLRRVSANWVDNFQWQHPHPDFAVNRGPAKARKRALEAGVPWQKRVLLDLSTITIF